MIPSPKQTWPCRGTTQVRMPHPTHTRLPVNCARFRSPISTRGVITVVATLPLLETARHESPDRGEDLPYGCPRSFSSFPTFFLFPFHFTLSFRLLPLPSFYFLFSLPPSSLSLCFLFCLLFSLCDL